MENTQQMDNPQTLKPFTSSDPHHFPKTILLGLGAFLIVTIGVEIGYFLGVNNQVISTQPAQSLPSTISLTATIASSPTVSTTTTPIKSIPLASTSGWKTVSNDGIGFMIPPEATCNNDTSCSIVAINSVVNGQTIPSSIYVKVRDYKGESRREAYTNTHTEILYCNPLYIEGMFGTVKALQIAAGDCSGSTGGMVTIVKNKLVIIDGGLWYNLKTKEISRSSIKDALISTLK